MGSPYLVLLEGKKLLVLPLLTSTGMEEVEIQDMIKLMNLRGKLNK